MESKSLVVRIAVLIVGFSLLYLLLWAFFVGARGIFGNFVGLLINIVLALFLVSGQNWARWVMSIRCGFGTIFSLSAWTQLGHADFSAFSLIRLWLLFAAVFSAGIAAYLLFSSRVNEHFNRGSGF